MKSSNNHKILFFTENYEHGGNARYLYDLLLHATNLNLNCLVYTNRKALIDSDKNQISKLNININEISLFSWGEIRNVYNLRRNYFLKVICLTLFTPLLPFTWIYQLIKLFLIIQKQNPAIVFACNGGYPGGGSVLRLCLASRILNKKIIFSCVALPSSSTSDQFRFFFWDKIIPNSINKLVVNSNKILDEMVKAHKFKATNSVVFYNGITGSEDYKIRNNKKVKFLFFSRIEIAKGIQTILDAITELHPSITENAEFHFYGSGSMEISVKDFAERNKAFIYYHGFFNGDPTPIFQSHDVYILPSYFEGFPYTVLDAMKNGVSIISTNVGGIPEMIENGKEGILINPGNVNELKEAINFNLANPKTREFFGINAKKKFDDNFEQNKIFEKNKNLFEFN